MPMAPPSINRQIQPLIKSLNERFEAYDTGAGRLKARWPEIVGETLSKITEPLKILRAKPNTKTVGALELKVEGAYAGMIQHQAQVIIDRVNLYLGASTIGRIRLIQGPVQKSVRPAPKATLKPLSAKDDLELQNSLSGISDARLKQQLLRLGRFVLQKDQSQIKEKP
jgi:hypothetical protein